MKEITVNGAQMKCYPLTAAQKLHYFTMLFSPAQVLNIGTGLYVKQDVDFDLLKKAVYIAYERFDSMRIRFVKDPENEQAVYQYIVPFEDRNIEFVDFSKWREEAAHDEMRRWTAIPFEPFGKPLNRVVLIKLPGGYNGLYLNVNHMTMDSSALIGFDRCVLEAYCSMKYGTEMPGPMRSYIEQLEKDLAYEDNSPALKRDEKFWEEKIAESEPIFTGFTGPEHLIATRRQYNDPNIRSAVMASESSAAAISVFHLENEPSMRLMKFCELYNVPMASLMIMGLRTVLSKFNSDEKDVSIINCIARRGTLSEKYSGGTRIHFFPLRTILENDMTFLDGIRAIQAEQNKIYRHANYDPIAFRMKQGEYWKIVPNSCYESISFTYQPLTLNKNTPDMPDIPYKSYWYTNGVASHALYLTLMHRPEDNGLNFNFEFKKDMVSPEEMEYFYYYLCRVLFRGIEDETRTIGEILEMI
ncbi:MAG: condensation domain-containing protein [Huintestinicola sp.]